MSLPSRRNQRRVSKLFLQIAVPLLAAAYCGLVPSAYADNETVGCFKLTGLSTCSDGTLVCYETAAENEVAYGVAVANLCAQFNALEDQNTFVTLEQTNNQNLINKLQKERVALQSLLNVVDDALAELPALRRKYKFNKALEEALRGNYEPLMNLIPTLAQALDSANKKLKKLSRK